MNKTKRPPNDYELTYENIPKDGSGDQPKKQVQKSVLDHRRPLGHYNRIHNPRLVTRLRRSIQSFIRKITRKKNVQ